MVKSLTLLLAISAVCNGVNFDLSPIEAGFQQLSQHRTKCTYQATQEFVELCRQLGADNIDANLRLRLAVNLSICEFSDAGLDYPEECKDLGSKHERELFLACVALLSLVEQFWTTYSGNYRKLRLLCYEELAPFLKDSLLDLYLNITKLYAEFFESAGRSAEVVNRVQDENLADLNSLRTIVVELFRETGEFEEKLRMQRKDHLQENQVAQEATTQRICFLDSLISNSIQQIINETEVLKGAITSSSSNFDLFGNRLELEHQKVFESAQSLGIVQNEILQSASYVSNALTEIKENALVSESNLKNLNFEVGAIGERFEELAVLFTKHFYETQQLSYAQVNQLGSEVRRQTEELGNEIFAAAFPMLSRLSSIGTVLEMQLSNASSTAGVLAAHLVQIEQKVSVLLKILFESLRAYLAALLVLGKTMLMIVLGYSALAIFWRFLASPSCEPKQFSIMSISSFSKSIALGMLTAYLVRKWLF